MNPDLENNVDQASHETRDPPTAKDVVDRLNDLWAEERDQCESKLPAFIPARIGRYDLSKFLGRGSFGMVCLARDELLNRDVALKLPRPEVLEDAERMQRFETEARITASLDHPGIVPLYEADLSGEHPFLASAFCPGLDLGQWLLQNTSTLSISEVVALVLKLTEAINYAHSKGIVHRDLKPTNILLQSLRSDVDTPDSLTDAAPRITDFGLAKSCGSDLVDTRSSMMIGTPLYMAPEQVGAEAAGSSATSVDIYALGCILFELLTGRPPIQGDSYVEVVDKLRHTLPPKLRTLRPNASRDLENICGKCLEKSPADRYESVQSFADDLQRFLSGQAVLAKPSPMVRRIQRSLTKQPLLTTLGVASILSLIAVCLLTFRYLNDIRNFEESLGTVSAEANQNEKAKDELSKSLAHIRYGDLMAAAYKALERGDHAAARALLLEYDSKKHGERTFAWQALESLTKPPEPLILRGHEGPVREIVELPDGEQLVSVGDDGTIRYWNSRTGKLIETIQASHKALSSLAISPDGKSIATGNTSVALWDVDSKEATPLDLAFDTTVEEIAFSQDGTVIAGGARNAGIRILALKTGRQIDLASDSGNESLIILDGLVYGIDISKSTRYLFSWDMITGKQVQDYPAPKNTGVGAAAISQERSLIAISNLHGGEVVLCSLEDGVEQWRSRHKPDSYSDVAFTPDHEFLVAAGKDGVLRVWNLNDCLGQEVPLAPITPLNSAFEFRAHDANITSVCCLADGRIATTSEDRTIKIWPLPQQRHTLTKLDAGVHHIAVIPQSDEIGMVHVNRRLERYAPTTDSFSWINGYHRQQAANDRLRGDLSVSPSGKLFAAFGVDSFIDIYQGDTGAIVFSCELGNTAKSVDFSPDEKLLAATGTDGHVSVWNLATGQQVFKHTLPNWGIAVRFSPCGKYLAVGGRVPEILLLKTEDWKLHGSLVSGSGTTCFSFSPNTDELATAHRDGKIRLWDLVTCKPTGQLLDELRVTCLSHHPSDGTLASAAGGAITLWDTRTQCRLGKIWMHRRNVESPMIAFTQTGERLIGLLQHFRSGQRINGLLVLE